MDPLRLVGNRIESTDQNVDPLRRMSSQWDRFCDENNISAKGTVFVRNVFVSRKRSGRKRQQKINRLNEQFNDLLAEALISATDWQLKYDQKH